MPSPVLNTTSPGENMRSTKRPTQSPWHIRQPISSTTSNLLKCAGILTFVLTYSFISYRQHRPAPLGNPDDTTVPNFSQFVEGFKAITEVRYNGERWIVEDFKTTFGRLAWGMSISLVVSVVIGILMGCYRAVESYLGLLISAMSREPATAMLVAFFILIGTGEWLYVGIVIFGTMPWITQVVFDAARNGIHRQSVYKMITLGATPSEQIYNLVYKQTLPKIIDAARLATSTAMIGLLAAEMTVGSVGFGYRMKISSRLLDMNVVYIYLVILVVAGYVIDFGFERFRMWWCPWYGERVEKNSRPTSNITKTAVLLCALGVCQ